MTALLLFRKLFAAGLCLSMIAGCVETSSVNQIDNPRRGKISGKIGLAPGVSPESIYVWLGGTSLKTYTGKTGDFEVILPASGRVPPFNVTASFDLYFYLANYKLSSIVVFVEDGQFLYSRGEVGPSGAMINPRFLQELLKINTRVEPDTVLTSYQGTIIVKVSLAAFLDSVVVAFPKVSGDQYGGMLIKNLDTGRISVYAPDGTPTRRMFKKIGREPFEYETVFSFQDVALTAGLYEAIPYFFIEQVNMPSGLLAGLGENVEALGPGFLKIPIRRKGGQFMVIAKEF
jgi:hypothetical protein